MRFPPVDKFVVNGVWERVISICGPEGVCILVVGILQLTWNFSSSTCVVLIGAPIVSISFRRF